MTDVWWNGQWCQVIEQPDAQGQMTIRDGNGYIQWVHRDEVQFF